MIQRSLAQPLRATQLRGLCRASGHSLLYAKGTRPARQAFNGIKVFCSTTVAAPTMSPSELNSQRLAELRKHMAAADNGAGVHAFIIPAEDPHMSEYAPDCFARRTFISNFTGSAGTAVVTTDKALLWTDGRYFLQGEQELSSEWTLMKGGTPGCPEIEDWLADNLPEGGRCGIDPAVHTVVAVRKLKEKLEAADKQVVPLLEGGNLVDMVWSEQPAPPLTPVRVHPAEWAGETVTSKLDKLRTQMKVAKVDVCLVTSLDEVAWLFNLRGKDVSCNPVFLSYAMVGADGSATLYVDERKLTDEVTAHLKEASVSVQDYSAYIPDVASKVSGGSVLWIDPSKVNYAVYHSASEAAMSKAQAMLTPGGRKKRDANGEPVATKAVKVPKFAVESPSAISAAKAVKNDAELAGMREAHLRDAVALCELICWLEKQVAAGKVLTEVEIDKELCARRAAQQGFMEPSFPTIAGSGPNGAIIHYRAKEATCGTVDANSHLLLDSGGQYDCGTTDITRTMNFGTPSDRQQLAYTRVLQGHIALDRAVFPEGTTGSAIDTLARMFLWKDGLNYRHGTGHGVGAALNVHEGPQSISTRPITTGLSAKMICSNEPGYYEDGAFGIRIENLLVIKEVDTPNRFGGIPYLGFERLTLVPIQTKMMKLDLMSESEVAWVDGYHASVWEAVSPRLSHAPEVLDWLKSATRPLKEQKA